jgi:choloylglycine hydrolase
VNEKGLAVSVLWLDETDYGLRDEAVPGISTALWGQFYLDSFATVGEAVRFTKATPLQPVPVRRGGEVSQFHVALADATGDSAVIECVGGRPRVYHGRKYAVLTNSPPLADQLKNLARYRGFGGERRVPSGVRGSSDRFVVASHLLAELPKPGTDRQAVADVLGLLRAVSLPRGTRWRAVADLTNRVYYFESAASPAVLWVRLDRLMLDTGSPVLKLDLGSDPDLAGEVSGKFEKAEPLRFTLPGD